MLYGVPEDEGLRCPYHGWMFNETGQCIEMPAEAPDSTFPSRVKMAGYPVQELCGLIFAYLGPEPVPLLPRWDMFVWDNVLRDIGSHHHPLQLVADHGELPGPGACGVAARPLFRLCAGTAGASGFEAANFIARRSDAVWRAAGQHEKIGFDEFQYGIIKRRVVAGRSEQDPEWRIGHPVLFPNILRVGSNFQYRVPVDDTHTLHVWFTAYPQPPGAAVPSRTRSPSTQVPLPTNESGQADWQMLDNNSGQDIMAWITQGAIADRSLEKLGESDKGIILYRRMLRQQLAILEAGGEPMNVFRDPEENVCIDLPWEGREDPWAYTQKRHHAAHGSGGQVCAGAARHGGPI